MSHITEDCVVKKTTRVVKKKDCSTRNKSKKGKCHVCKKRVGRRTIKVICKQPKAPIVNLTTPPAEVNVQTNPPEVHVTTPAPEVHITTPAPEVHITTPPPIVNVETHKPDVHVKVETPKTEVKVKVDYPDEGCNEELRELLREYWDTEVELFTSSGAGSGGEPPNRIGMVEKIGKSTLVLRPTTGNDMDQIVIFSICHIIGFRPYSAVAAP
ncbi:hypothetical protein GQF01_28220 [Paenibacillus sp. 5J-6]|uniref:Uncharacterized protein n=1 Tax=Paenibacillus silvestris TaxID=2606219 RepID=A0A6L8V6X1_9BACL|nr:hypothetical protein [Paenibacillus silvestris]MZQ85994.1 hypothetical protein [Paenibacillus silvestris]